MNRPSTPVPAAQPEATATPSSSPWPAWIVGLVALGALLTAAGGLLALHPAGEHLNAAGRDYADYFLTRNVAMAAMLLLMLAVRARRVLTGLMVLTAMIQGLDAITAATTGRPGLLPIDLVFAAAFLVGARRLAAGPLWRVASWREWRGRPIAWRLMTRG